MPGLPSSRSALAGSGPGPEQSLTGMRALVQEQASQRCSREGIPRSSAGLPPSLGPNHDIAKGMQGTILGARLPGCRG
jgi:hypothetical protein